MKRYEDIRDIASQLDEVIEKGEKLEEKEQIHRKMLKKSEIAKSLTFDPSQPHSMRADSPYYNPYRMLEDGSFAPHDVAHWVSLGKNPDNYREVAEYYKNAGEAVKSLRELPDLIMKGAVKSKPVGGSKDRGIPVGTIHEFQGQKFQKTSNSPVIWKPVLDGHAGKLLNDPKAHDDFERTVHHHKRITSAMEQRKRENKRDGMLLRKFRHELKSQNKKTHVDSLQELSGAIETQGIDIEE